MRTDKEVTESFEKVTVASRDVDVQNDATTLLGKKLKELILSTPTGTQRNIYTELNILFRLSTGTFDVC